MEFINRENEIYIIRYYPSKNPRAKYKKGDVIHNYDYLEVNYSNPDYQSARLIEYAYSKYYFLVVNNATLTVIDVFDICRRTRDEAIDEFLDYCKEKNYKISFEIK